MLLVALVVVFFVCQSVGMPAPPDSVLNSASETMVSFRLLFVLYEYLKFKNKR